jgi:hypothetical protein
MQTSSEVNVMLGWRLHTFLLKRTHPVTLYSMQTSSEVNVMLGWRLHTFLLKRTHPVTLYSMQTSFKESMTLYCHKNITLLSKQQASSDEEISIL